MKITVKMLICVAVLIIMNPMTAISKNHLPTQWVGNWQSSIDPTRRGTVTFEIDDETGMPDGDGGVQTFIGNVTVDGLTCGTVQRNVFGYFQARINDERVLAAIAFSNLMTNSVPIPMPPPSDEESKDTIPPDARTPGMLFIGESDAGIHGDFMVARLAPKILKMKFTINGPDVEIDADPGELRMERDCRENARATLFNIDNGIQPLEQMQEDK